MTLDSLNAFTVTVTSQSVLWKYTYLNLRILMDDRLPLAFKRCGFEPGTVSFYIYIFVLFFPSFRAIMDILIQIWHTILHKICVYV